MGEKEYLFVYGTLLPEHRGEMSRWLARRAERIGPGRVRAKLLDLGFYPGAVPTRERNRFVFGELYLLRDPESTLRTLDAYEGRSFARERVTVTLENGARRRGWIYLYRGPTEGRRLIASGRFSAPPPASAPAGSPGRR
jgi:gamma-glutamylcyclotransferase (GGCT)/AIG2-like uncharacterized protein YtfP